MMLRQCNQTACLLGILLLLVAALWCIKMYSCFFFFLLPASISKLITAFFFRCKMIAYNTWIYGVSQCTYILILTDHATNTESVVRFHHLVLYYTQGLSSHHIVISVLEGRCEWTKKKKVEQLWAKPEAGGRGGGESQMCRLDPLETVGKMKGRGLVLCL